MPHGGQRPGAGRPKGVANRASALREQQIAETGPTPVDIMVKVMRYNWDCAEQESKKKNPNWRKVMTFQRLAIEAAYKAGVFVHQKMSTLDPSPKLDLSKLTSEEIDLVVPILKKALAA